MSWPELRLPDGPRPLYRRIGWLLVIWAASIAALGAVATVLRWWLAP